MEKHISFSESRILIDGFTLVATGPTYAAVVKLATKSISINTDLAWCYCENKCNNIADVVKVQRQTTKASKNKKREINKMTQVSLDSRRSSTVVTCPSIPYSGKDTKSNKKDRWNKRRLTKL